MKHRLPFLVWFWPWGFVASIVLVVFLGMAARPAYRSAKRWRAGTYLSQAEEAFAQGDLAKAQQRARLCLQFNPEAFDAWRLLARVADRRGDPGSLNLWTTVVQSGAVRDADRVALGEAALRENFPLVAERQADALFAQESPPKEAYNLAGLIAVRQQKPALAREWFNRALAVDPEFSRAQLNLARVRLFFPDSPAAEKTAIEELRALGLRRDEWGLEALRMLVEWALAHPDRMPFDPELAARLETHPQAKIRDRCRSARWQMQARPERRQELLDGLTANADRLPPEDQRELGSWLNNRGLHSKTLEVFPVDARSRGPLLLVQLDAMAALKQWQKLDQFLQQDIVFDDQSLLWLYRARAARELGKENLYELNWKQAQRAAEHKPLALRYLGYYAETLGDLPRAVEAYEALSQIPEFQIAALLRLVGPYEKLGRTRDLFRTLQRLAALRPDDPAIRNDVAYLSLLLNDSSVRGADLARQVYQTDPRLPAFAATYALSRLREGDPAVALKVMKSFRLEDLPAPGWQAVYAAALLANGQKAEAEKVAGKIDRKNLKPEEKKLVEELLK